MASYWAECLADTPTLLIKFDEASGNFADSSGGGHTAVVSGTAWTYQAAGPDATGIPYAGTLASGSLATVTHHADLNLGNGPFSIELWMKKAAAATGYFVTQKGTGNGYMVWVTSTDRNALALAVGSQHVYGSDADLGWHHWVFTRPSGADGKVWRDKVDVTNLSSSRTFADDAVDLLVGNASGGLVGSIAGLALYKSELSSTRIAAHYDARSTADVTLQYLRPDADTATGSWATTPLWSKIEESSPDGTVVSETSA